MTEIAALVRHVAWIQASLDLRLDMERNESDGRFASASPQNEIVYTFDTNVFELLVGGFDEFDGEGKRIYSDRRRSVGIFNTREWRETPAIAPADEERRIALNRQTAILASEWLFSGQLPAMQGGTIHISERHLGELRTRWQHLIDHFRRRAREPEISKIERLKIRALLCDRSSPNFDGNGSPAESPQNYMARQDQPLRDDLEDFWLALTERTQESRSDAERDFWGFAFSRRLAAELADMRATAPLAQLVRINAEIASKLRLIEHAGHMDSPEIIPASETLGFWRDRLATEFNRRETLGIAAVSRTEVSIVNDAATLATVQAIANSATRSGESRRFVFVTADNLLIDVYREWHCHLAMGFEPYVVRPVRHFAPLLNAANITDPRAPEDAEARERRDIFPALQQAINPFLSNLNLTPEQASDKRSLGGPKHGEDAVRWPRDRFALRLRHLLQEYRSALARGDLNAGRRLATGIANQRLFPGYNAKTLQEAGFGLKEVAERGRRIERSAIGLGFHRLCVRLEALQVTADILDKFEDQDEAALASYIQDMVDAFGKVNLDLQVRSLNIAKELHEFVSADSFHGVGNRRVPLSLNLRLTEGENSRLVAVEADSMIEQALRNRSKALKSRRGKHAFEFDLRMTDLGSNGGYRLYALYACIALRLGNWAPAEYYAQEALQLGERNSNASAQDLIELQYLFALAARFNLGAGPTRDITGPDISYERYLRARSILVAQVESAETIGEVCQARASAELVALLLFGSIWSMASVIMPDQHYPRLPADLHRNELPYAWSLSRKLCRSARNGLFATDDAALRAILEQVGSNAAAVHALASIHTWEKDSAFTQIVNDQELCDWIEDKQGELARPNEGSPPIKAFYEHWYRRLKTAEAERPPLEQFGLDLWIDTIVNKLFMHVIG